MRDNLANNASANGAREQERPMVPYQLSTISELFSFAYSLFKRYFWKFFGIAVLLFIAWLIPIFLLWLIGSFTGGVIIAEKILYLIQSIIHGFFTLLFLVSCLILIREHTGGMNAIRLAFKRFSSLLYFLVLIYVVWAVGMIPEVVSALGGGSISPLLQLLSFIFLVAGTIYISQAPFFFVLEKATPLESLQKSFRYVRDVWWKVLLRVIVMPVIFGILLIVAILISFILIAFFPPLGAVLLLLLIIFFPLFFTGFTLCYGYALYRDLTNKRELSHKKNDYPTFVKVMLCIGVVTLLLGLILFLQGSLVTDEEWRNRDSKKSFTELIQDASEKSPFETPPSDTTQ